MKQLIKIKNSDLSFKLNLNYNNVYSRLKMLLGSKASLFADITTKSTGTTWYSEDDAEYMSLDQAPKGEANNLKNALSSEVAAVRKEMMADSELSKYVGDILEIPDNSFVFYRVLPTGGYKFILTGWGCRFIHQNATDPNSGFIKRISHELEFPEEKKTTDSDKPSIIEILRGMGTATGAGTTEKSEFGTTEKRVTTNTDNSDTSSSSSDTQTTSASTQSKGESKEQPKHEIKRQKVSVKVLDQNNSEVKGEPVIARSSLGDMNLSTTDDGVANIGELPYGETFSVEFPNLQGHVERSFEVVSGVDIYDAYIKKLIKYSPVLFVEDQNGNAVQDYNVKVVVNGQDSIFNSGLDGVVQLPTMQEGQKFIVIDTANYANTEEYNITQAEAKTPYHFHIKRAEKAKVGITVLDKSGNPIPKATVDLAIGSTPCQQITAEDGRAEFPGDVFVAGDIPVNLTIKGKGLIKSNLKYSPDNTEYTIQLQDKKPGDDGKGFNWKWLALIPLLVLLAWGGKELYDRFTDKNPTIAEMEKGIVLIRSEEYYSIDLGFGNKIKQGQEELRYYFTYDVNENEITALSMHLEEIPLEARVGWGTGFIVSKDGLIATNRHVAAPIPPKGVENKLKQIFIKNKQEHEHKKNELNNVLNQLGTLATPQPGPARDKYIETAKELDEVQEQIDLLDQIIQLGNYSPTPHCDISVAFVNTIIENPYSKEDFKGCTKVAQAETESYSEKDVALIKLKDSKDLPQDFHVFTIPKEDILDSNVPLGEYKITVLGYNAGPNLANIKGGIHPQPQPGVVIQNDDPFRVTYNASTLGGSSGSPVINEKGELVAVNNSGVSIKQGFNFGIRAKYLREILDDYESKHDKK